MSAHGSFAFAAFLAATAAASAADTVLAAKSAYVALLKPGEVFTPVEGASGAGVEPVVDTDEVFPAAYVEDFTIDGDMTKGVWKKAKRVPELAVRNGKADMGSKSDIRILYSKTAIYIGATLWQDMAQMTAKWDQRDMPIWNDDNIEVFIFAPSDNGNRLYQLVLNPINSFADLRDGIKNYWVRGNKHATKRFNDRWTMVLAAEEGLDDQHQGQYKSYPWRRLLPWRSPLLQIKKLLKKHHTKFIIQTKHHTSS